PISYLDRPNAKILLDARTEGMKIEENNPVWLKAHVAPLVGSLMEWWDINIERILTSYRALQNRVEHVIVEGVGGWLVPIRSDYFMSDLAVEMSLPVLVVAQNRLGCLNHTALTVRTIADHGLRCSGVLLTG